MSASYEKIGVRFLYPENWRITDEETTEWPRTVSVESPSGAFWSLMIYDRDHDPSELTEKVLATMRREYESLEASLVREQFKDVEATGHDMQFYCLDFVVSSRAVATRHGDRTMLLVWQAEDRDFEQLEPVFRAITTSLFS